MVSNPVEDRLTKTQKTDPAPGEDLKEAEDYIYTLMVNYEFM